MSVCPKCKEGSFLPGEPTGSINTDFQGAYFAPSPNKDLESKRAIVFLTDGFGLPLKNCKIMADNLATKLECDVWVPDYFNGVCWHFHSDMYSKGTNILDRQTAHTAGYNDY